MVNKITRILFIIVLTLLIFYTGMTDVKAVGYENSIECVYVLPLDYYIGSVSTSHNQIKITYTRIDGKTEIKYNNTLNSDEDEKFVENSFDDYIIGKSSAGSKKNRGENYRTCPSWIEYYKSGANDHIDPINRDTFYNSGETAKNMYNVAGNYVEDVYISDELTFTSSKTSRKVSEASSIKKAKNPYYLFLYSQTIDGMSTSKGNSIAKDYFETIYFNKNAKNILTKFEKSNFNKSYLDLTNYSFGSYDEFKKYALSSEMNEKFDSKMTESEWKERWYFLYTLEQWNNFASFLQKSYSNIFTSNYDNEIYLKMIQYTKLPREKNVLQNAEELDDREDSSDAYKKDVCLAECSNSDGTLISSKLTECKNYDTKYSKYLECDKCNEKCRNVSADSYGNCMSGCYGEENYNRLLEIKKANNERIGELRDKLHKAQAPSFNIKFDSEGYKVQCEDVDFLHYIYVAMRILAPILVILFGTLDYTKSVLGSDEQKILEARKKFPKRLILLILFILVPFMIDLILDVFDVETSLMSCIIKGE